jgi:hypothetical protein
MCSREIDHARGAGPCPGEAGLGIARIDGAGHDAVPRRLVGGGSEAIRLGGKEVGEDGGGSRDGRVLARVRGVRGTVTSGTSRAFSSRGRGRL